MTLNLIDLLGGFLMVVALSAYWSASHESFERIWLSLIPRRNGRARAASGAASKAPSGRHLRAELAESAIAMLLVAIAFRLGRLPTPILPALAVGVLRIVPFFGPVLAAAAAALAGMGGRRSGRRRRRRWRHWRCWSGWIGASPGRCSDVRHASPTLTVDDRILFVEAFGTPGCCWPRRSRWPPRRPSNGSSAPTRGAGAEPHVDADRAAHRAPAPPADVAVRR